MMKCDLQQMFELPSLVGGVTCTRAVWVPSENGALFLQPFPLSLVAVLWTSQVFLFKGNLMICGFFSRIENSSFTKEKFYCGFCSVLFFKKARQHQLILMLFPGYSLFRDSFLGVMLALSSPLQGVREALQYVPVRLLTRDKWDFSSSHSHSNCLESQEVEWGGGVEGDRLMKIRRNEFGRGRRSKPMKSCKNQKSNSKLDLEMADWQGEIFYREKVARRLHLKQPKNVEKWDFRKARAMWSFHKRQKLLRVPAETSPRQHSPGGIGCAVIWEKQSVCL